jgi:hypothetical protein
VQALQATAAGAFGADGDGSDGDFSLSKVRDFTHALGELGGATEGGEGGSNRNRAALSLPQLLGGAETSNEAAARWRKLRNYAKAIGSFKTAGGEAEARREEEALAAALVAVEHDDSDDADDSDDDATPGGGRGAGAGDAPNGGDTPADAAGRRAGLVQDAIKQWMMEGGQGIRAKQAAKKQAASEKQFRGQPWKCTVCAKRHFQSVKEMQRGRCSACGAARDAVVTAEQRWRSSLVPGQWVETRRHPGSGFYLARLLGVTVASRATLEASRKAAEARALVPATGQR